METDHAALVQPASPSVEKAPMDREEMRRLERPIQQQRRVQRVLILGGGFGGFYTARRLQKLFRNHAGVEITLVAHDNYFLMTPLLFEAGSGVLEPRHVVNPVRRLFTKARFVEADIHRVDFERRIVHAYHDAHAQAIGGGSSGHAYELPYDQLVLALGGVTNRTLIPGSEHATEFKTLGDAIYLRNGIIDLFEQADVEEETAVRKRLLTMVIVGGGLVGIELIGELTEFVENLLRSYPRIPRELVRFVLIEAHPRILPEMEEDLAKYATDTLWRRGVNLITGTRVSRIEPGKVFLPDGTVIEAQTILLAAGVAANPLLADMPLEKAKNGRILVDATMRCKDRPEVWALGDCAIIPDKDGKPYPPLAQHALREARILAGNIARVIERGGKETELQPFVYETMGQL
ncbi:MAG TPA: FAD-dependent oxidoreductase, partial [Phycisphaerae bacterium]